MKARNNDGSSYSDWHDGNRLGKKLLIVDAPVDGERMRCSR
jgi:hypothetical protein